MYSTRRQFSLMLALATAASGLAAPAWPADEDYSGYGNVFISPHGKPFRAKLDAPYPVVDWFHEADKNADGKIARTEFMADAEAFFVVLDRRHQGRIDNFDIQNYEHNICPEVLGLRVEMGDAGRSGGARLWLADMQGDMGGIVPSGTPPGGDTPTHGPDHLDESNAGASPYSFFEEPEPVTVADLDFRGFVTRENFMKIATRHFNRLDPADTGFLTLDKLPKTQVQRAMERRQRRRR